jgi:hypothetical protein
MRCGGSRIHDVRLGGGLQGRGWPARREGKREDVGNAAAAWGRMPRDWWVRGEWGTAGEDGGRPARRGGEGRTAAWGRMCRRKKDREEGWPAGAGLTCEQIASEEGWPAGGEKKRGRSFSLTFILSRRWDSENNIAFISGDYPNRNLCSDLRTKT